MDRMPDRFTSSADANAMIARTAPAVLELLGDGVARTKKAIVAALAERHAKDDVVRTLMRLAVTGQVTEVDHKYRLEPATGLGQG
jgi:carbohydrate-binding DOMON domain-containing protein